MTPNCFVNFYLKMFFSRGERDGLATTFNLVAFLVFMIALVKETVNHLRTLESMCKTPT